MAERRKVHGAGRDRLLVDPLDILVDALRNTASDLILLKPWETGGDELASADGVRAIEVGRLVQALRRGCREDQEDPQRKGQDEKPSSEEDRISPPGRHIPS